CTLDCSTTHRSLVPAAFRCTFPPSSIPSMICSPSRFVLRLCVRPSRLVGCLFIIIDVFVRLIPPTLSLTNQLCRHSKEKRYRYIEVLTRDCYHACHMNMSSIEDAGGLGCGTPCSERFLGVSGSPSEPVGPPPPPPHMGGRLSAVESKL